MSHYNVLKMAYENYKNDECIVIFEDDFCILNENIFNDFINDFESIKNNKDWSVITFTRRLGRYYGKYNDNFSFVKGTQTTTGYIIKTIFIKTFLKQIKISMINLMNNLPVHENAIDQIWKPLQNENNFIYYNNMFCSQLPCYSDIEKKIIDYKAEFLLDRNYICFIFLIFVIDEENINYYKNLCENIFVNRFVYYYVIQNNNICNNYEFNNNDNILYVKILDDDKNMNKLFISTLDAINNNFDYKYILKISNNIEIININYINKLLNILRNNNILENNYHYGGKYINKLYCDEKFYFLSKYAVKNLLNKKDIYYNYNKNNGETTGHLLDNEYKKNAINFDIYKIFKILNII